MGELTKKEIWDCLSTIDITDRVKHMDGGLMDGNPSNENMRLPYLSIHDAHSIMMDNFPEYTWVFLADPNGREVHYFNNGSAEVQLSMTIGKHTVHTSRPVYGKGHTDSLNPSASDIHNSKQRCRVQAMAAFGLGFDLWENPDRYAEVLMKEEKAKEALKNAMPSHEINRHKDWTNQVRAITSAKQKEPTKFELLWKDVSDCKTRAEAVKAKAKVATYVKSKQVTQDEIDDAWKALCKTKGWKA